MFIRFVSFFRFPVGGRGSSHSCYDKTCARRIRRFRWLMRSLWHGRARYRRFSCIFKNRTINEKAEKPQRFTKYAPPYPARVDKPRSIGRVVSQSLSLTTIKISTYLSYQSKNFKNLNNLKNLNVCMSF